MSSGTETAHLAPSLRYELAVLTHGDSRPLVAALRSFRENVRPLPARIRVFADATAELSYVVGAVRGVFPDVEDPAVSATHPTRQAGFCGATGRLWNLCAADGAADYIYWLEHDFLHDRSVSLEQLAGVLADDRVAQVALIRNACNEKERQAGGLVESLPAGTFQPEASIVEAEGVRWNVRWLEHQAFFTTNPSLMRRDFMAANPWPDDGEPFCEGRFGLALVERGYRFAYWGEGYPWVRHVGVRDGKGY